MGNWWESPNKAESFTKVAVGSDRVPRSLCCGGLVERRMSYWVGPHEDPYVEPPDFLFTRHTSDCPKRLQLPACFFNSSL